MLRVILDVAEAELEEDHFSIAIGKFSEAVNLSRGFPSLETTVVSVGVKLATELLDRHWPVSRSLLMEAEKVDSKTLIPRELWDQVQERERDQAINCALHAADNAASNGSSSTGLIQPVRQRLSILLSRYPGEARLQTRLQALEALCSLQLQGHASVQADREAKASEAEQLLARAIWARAREFQRGGFDQEAIDQLNQLQRTEPAFPGLEEEIARCKNRLNRVQPATPVVPVESRPALVKESKSRAAAWLDRWVPLLRPRADQVKILATVALLALFLIGSAVLLWLGTQKNHSKVMVAMPDAKTLSDRPLKRAPAAVIATPDDELWAKVNPNDADAVENYLSKFPAGIHRNLAVQALTDIRIQRRKALQNASASN